MNGGVPDDVGSHQAPGPFGPPQDEVQHLVVLVQVADSLGRGRHQRGQGLIVLFNTRNSVAKKIKKN